MKQPTGYFVYGPISANGYYCPPFLRRGDGVVNQFGSMTSLRRRDTGNLVSRTFNLVFDGGNNVFQTFPQFGARVGINDE